MIISVDLVPYKIRVMTNRKIIGRTLPTNLEGTLLYMRISSNDYSYYIENKPEEAIIHTIFSKNTEVYVPMEIKLRWDNNTTTTVGVGRLLLVTTAIPISNSIWKDESDLWETGPENDISLINREKNNHNRTNDIDKTFSSFFTDKEHTLNTCRKTIRNPIIRQEVPKIGKIPTQSDMVKCKQNNSSTRSNNYEDKNKILSDYYYVTNVDTTKFTSMANAADNISIVNND